MRRPPYFALPLLILLVVGASPEPHPSAGDHVPRSPAGPVSSTQTIGKRALIVAIADYPDGNPEDGVRYGDLNADNDVPLIRAALLQHAFDSNAIEVLRDSHATKEGIVSAFRSSLIDAAEPGDVAVFHYSGHGHQITDDDGDEIDGLDELLVPYDAPAALDGGYGGERHLRDDELGELLLELRRKVGPTGSVVVFIDACFSGSATRAQHDLPVRGVLEPLGAPAEVLESAEARGHEGAFEARGPADDDLGRLVFLSASRHDEVSREVRDPEQNGLPVGSLSLAVSRSLTDLQPATTYRTFFESVKEQMAALVSSQTPQLEGDVDAVVFGGRVVAQTPYLTVDQIEGPRSLWLRGGTLVGLQPGTRVALHQRGTSDPEAATAMATGTVEASDPLYARVSLDQAIDSATAERAWVFVIRYAYADLSVGVLLDPNLPPALADPLRSTLESIGVVRLVETAPDLVVAPLEIPGEDPRVGLTAAAENVLVESIPADGTEAWAETIGERVQAYAHNRFLRQVELNDTEFRVRLELTPALGEVDSRGFLTWCDTLPAGAEPSEWAEWEVAPGDFFFVRLIHEGERGAYVTLLDLRPDGSVEQVWPDTQARGEDNYLAAGRTYDLGCGEVTPPYGTDVLKLFATPERVNFEPVVRTQGRTRSSEHPLEVLLADALSGTRFGLRRSAASGYTSSVTLRVVPEARGRAVPPPGGGWR